MAGAEPQKGIKRMKQCVEHVNKNEGSMTYLLYPDIVQKYTLFFISIYRLYIEIYQFIIIVTY